MIKKGFIVTLIFIFSTFIQLISQIIVTRIFGATLNLDIFLAAVAVPTIFVTIIYGTLNDAFLPIFGEQKTKDEKRANEYFVSMFFFLTILSFLIALVFSFFAKPISELLYGSRGEEFVKNVAVQMSYMSYSIPLSIVATLLGTYFYANKKLSRFPLAQLMGSLSNLIIILWFAPLMGTWALILAFVINIFIQIIFVFPFSLFTEIKILNFINLTNFKNFLTLLLSWVPLIIGSFALRSDALLIRSFGSHLPSGYLVYLNLISKIFALATGVMTIGIQIVLLPHLIEYLSKKEYERAFYNVRRSKITAVGIVVFVTFILAILSPFFINLLFVGGKFTANDAQITSSLIPLFIIPAIGWGINSVFFQPLLALKKQLQLGAINILSMILGWGIGSVVTQYLGPLAGITSGLIILLFTGIIGSEILWQYYKKKLIGTNHERNLSV